MVTFTSDHPMSDGTADMELHCVCHIQAQAQGLVHSQFSVYVYSVIGEMLYHVK